MNVKIISIYEEDDSFFEEAANSGCVCDSDCNTDSDHACDCYSGL